MRIGLLGIVLAGLVGAGLATAGDCGKGEGCCRSKGAEQCEVAVSTEATTQPAAAPVNKTCPVMAGPVDPKVTTVHDGKVIGFCCEDCIATFKKDPAKYMKNLK
jgi:YHS domain-containing protein